MLVLGAKNNRNCCYKCEDREIGCHDYCEHYKKFCEKNEAIRRAAKNKVDYNGETNWSYTKGRKHHG